MHACLLCILITITSINLIPTACCSSIYSNKPSKINCGWFKNLCKKVSSAVQKVTNTVVGKVGATLTVAVPLVIGVVAGVMAAPVLPVIAAGALVGAGIAAGTAMISTHQQDGKIDWETVGICAGVGAAVGAIVSGASYGITTLIKSATQVSSALKNIETNRRTHILQDKHGWSNLGDNTWDTVSSAIKHTLKKWFCIKLSSR